VRYFFIRQIFLAVRIAAFSAACHLDVHNYLATVFFLEHAFMVFNCAIREYNIS